MMLRKLIRFTDKEELFRVLLKKPLKDKQSKKAVRLSIIPTDVEDEGEGFEIKKKKYILIDIDITETQCLNSSASTRPESKEQRNDRLFFTINIY